MIGNQERECDHLGGSELIQNNELFNALIGIGVLIFLFTQLRGLRRLPKRGIFLSVYMLLLTGWVAAVLESAFWLHVLNVAEHICYALSALLFSIWCWVALRPGSRNSS